MFRDLCRLLILNSRPTCLFAFFASIPLVSHAQPISFEHDVQPVLEAACVHCHNDENAEGELRLDERDFAIAGGSTGPAIVPGKPNQSLLLSTILLPEDDDLAMPPDGPRLDARQVDRIRKWIAAGAVWPKEVALEPKPRIDFREHIQPILETRCVSCHQHENAEGGLDLSTKQSAYAESDSGKSIVPFRPDESVLYELTTLSLDDDRLMPPSNAGPPLPKEDRELLRLWIAQGAVWPTGIVLRPQRPVDPSEASPDTMELVRKIREQILKKSAEDGPMESYDAQVPLTGAKYSMVAVSGGSFLMGSPEDEPYRQEIEGPQTEVKVAPFWIGKYEVTWDEYEPFMISEPDRRKDGSRTDYDEKIHTIVDAVSQPTGPYTEMSFGMGQKGFPAISMTQHAASKYCQWLSAQTGHFYRLPTEAEWEYACRAGTTTAYSFGNDESKLGEYAWYYDNANEKYQKVGRKKPNPWGIYDMHGNVAEWTFDQFVPDYFHRISKMGESPFIRPETLYPRSVRGGSWDDDPDRLRSAARRGSDPSWKMQDPQLPKSIWYHTNAQFLGFRIVRPRKIPSAEEMYLFWNSAKGKL